MKPNNLFNIYSVITGKNAHDISVMTPHELRVLMNQVDYDGIALHIDSMCDSNGQQFELIEKIKVEMNNPYISDSKNFMFFAEMILDIEGKAKKYNIAVYSDYNGFDSEANIHGLVYL